MYIQSWQLQQSELLVAVAELHSAAKECPVKSETTCHKLSTDLLG